MERFRNTNMSDRKKLIMPKKGEKEEKNIATGSTKERMKTS
jgi:hypothetical protein